MVQGHLEDYSGNTKTDNQLKFTCMSQVEQAECENIMQHCVAVVSYWIKIVACCDQRKERCFTEVVEV